MANYLDLNADLGEGCGDDAALMDVITSCNIACGGHAGDPASMREALQLAKDHGVAAGAHPSFPDRANFGRARSSLSGRALEAALVDQIETLRSIASELDMALCHLKPHGALYNMASVDPALSESIVTALRETLPHAKLVGPPGSALQAAATAGKVSFLAEGFADRAYEADGRLRDRAEPGAMIETATDQANQAVNMALHHHVFTYDGQVITLPVDTICVHGDTPDAAASAKAIRASLEQAGVTLRASP